MLLLLKNKIASSNEQIISSFVKAASIEYPIKIENIFPYWTNIKKDITQPNLIDLIKEYYNWLYSDTTNPRSGAAVNSNFGFFELHKIKDWNNYTTDFNFQSVLNLYLPDLDKSLIGTEITKEEVKEILNGIKIKLYDKKGTEQSFKYLISLVFGIDQNNVWITYPKKYLFNI